MKAFLHSHLILAIVFAATTTLAFDRKTSEQKLEGVQLTDTIMLSELEGTHLKSVSQGLRSKKVALMNFRVYVGELLVPRTTDWDGKTGTFENSPQAGVLMTFLRDVSGKDVASAFKDSLEENDIKAETEELKNFFSVVKKVGDIKEKEMLIVARLQSGAGDKVLVMIPNRFQEIVTGPAGWSQTILKIWTGKPTDSGMKALQKALFK